MCYAVSLILASMVFILASWKVECLKFKKIKVSQTLINHRICSWLRLAFLKPLLPGNDCHFKNLMVTLCIYSKFTIELKLYWQQINLMDLTAYIIFHSAPYTLRNKGKRVTCESNNQVLDNQSTIVVFTGDSFTLISQGIWSRMKNDVCS